MRTITKLAAVLTASAFAVPATSCTAVAGTVDDAPPRVVTGAPSPVR